MLRILATLLLCAHAKAQGYCDEHLGIAASMNADYDLAYSALKSCEHDPDATGRSLHYLQALIWYEGYGSSESMVARYKLSQKFVCRSAIRGYELSVHNIASNYLYGDQHLGVAKNEESMRA
tara:strand:+ start:2128 stop:2493 length:366 start_codon:yes stop_codon:yes gene_type:complete